jgi:hypothetical protein
LQSDWKAPQFFDEAEEIEGVKFTQQLLEDKGF